MENLKTKSVGEFVANDYRTAAVFKKYGIEFCCQGNRTINDVCEEKNINPKSVLNDLEEAIHTKDENTIDYQSWPLDLLAVYIEKKYHRYFDQITPVIMQYLDKICELHGNIHPELFEINEEFNVTARELAVHMKKEEFILFPYIRKMVIAKNNLENAGSPHLGSVKHPIKLMKMEHDIEGERFKKIAILCDNYNPPTDASDNYKATLSLLKEYEDDLHLHIHLENNILYPKAMELEKKTNVELMGSK